MLSSHNNILTSDMYHPLYMYTSMYKVLFPKYSSIEIRYDTKGIISKPSRLLRIRTKNLSS